ncbi:MAG: LptF/LptG family permease [Thermonemataceae bacterium]
MKILDKYIIKKFLTTFVFVVFIFLSIIVVIDIIEKIQDFTKMEATLKTIIVEYYLNFIPYIGNTISPIMVFITTVFVASQMASRTEVVAILSSGISFPRFLKPFLLGAGVLAVVIFYLTGWVIPNANKVRVNFENTHIRSRYYYNQRDIHLKIAPKTYAYMESYNNYNNIGYKFTLEVVEGNELKEKLVAQRIIWDTTLQKWQIENYSLRKINNLEEKLTKGSKIDTTLNLSPEDFQSKHLFNEKLTLPELNRYIALLKERGSEDVKIYITERYSRFTYPFAVIILTFMGVIVASQKNRRGVGAKIALGFVLAFIYILFYIVGTRALANSGRMPILLAVWLPNLLFITISIIMYRIFILQDERLRKIIFFYQTLFKR